MENKATKNGIRKLLSNDVDVEVFESINSTNLYAKERILQGKTEDFLVVAREQSAGKGRFARKFFSPKDCGAYFSLVISPKSESEVGLVTPLCAVAVRNAILKTFGKDTEIKWVNDLYLDGKKCVGILCEAVAVSGKIAKIVLGIGINICEKEGGADKEIADIVGFVGDGKENCVNRIIASCVNEIYRLHNDFDKNEVVGEYKKHSLLVGKDVVVKKVGCQDVCARVEDIDDECRLVVRYAGGAKEALNSGEVQAKLAK